VPAGTFHHNTNFTLDSVTMTGAGDVSVLVATNKANSSILLTGDSPAIKAVKLTSPKADVRDTTPWSTGVEIRAARFFTVDNVTVTRMGSAGIFSWRASGPGKIVNNRVFDTLADAIHITGGSHDIVVANNHVRRAGDDMVAVVGYEGDGQPYNVLIQANDVADQTWGRGIAVVGGKDVTIQNNKVARTRHAAGIYVASEPYWKTYGVSNVLVKNNELAENSGPTGQGAFLVSGLHGNINWVRFEGNTIADPVHDSIKLEGSNSNTALINNKMNDAEQRGINIVAGSNVYCSGNTLNGSQASNGRCTGALNFTVTGSPLTYTPTSTCPAR
jgi:hypothetical protein